jgi:hypothetical protein
MATRKVVEKSHSALYETRPRASFNDRRQQLAPLMEHRPLQNFFKLVSQAEDADFVRALEWAQRGLCYVSQRDMLREANMWVEGDGDVASLIDDPETATLLQVALAVRGQHDHRDMHMNMTPEE